jgi:hypothetical protein
VSEGEYSLQGYFELTAEGEVVALRCSWPFDFNADEWIDIRNRYYAVDYSKAVSDAAARGVGTGKAHGITGGFLEITGADGGFFIEFSRPQSGWCASSLQLHVGRPVGELSLQSLPFRLICNRIVARHLTRSFRKPGRYRGRRGFDVSSRNLGPALMAVLPIANGRKRIRAVIILLYLLLLPICSVVMGLLGFWIGRCARKLPIIDDNLPWTLRRRSDPDCHCEHSSAGFAYLPVAVSAFRRTVQPVNPREVPRESGMP